MVGRKFEFLEVMGFSHIHNRRKYWKCICKCGRERIVSGTALRTGHTASCGHCKQTKHGYAKRGKTPEYRAWHQMLQRCNNKNDRNYTDYGGRGINVCADWRDFQNFIKDVGPRPSVYHSLDRINNNLGYYPDNVRWALPHEQQNNKRTNILITINGIVKTRTQWLHHFGTNRRTYQSRLKRGWTVERALKEKPS